MLRFLLAVPLLVLLAPANASASERARGGVTAQSADHGERSASKKSGSKKSSGKRSGGSRDGGSRDGGSRDGGSRDDARSRDGGPRDNGPSPGREAASRDGGSRDDTRERDDGRDRDGERGGDRDGPRAAPGRTLMEGPRGERGPMGAGERGVAGPGERGVGAARGPVTRQVNMGNGAASQAPNAGQLRSAMPANFRSSGGRAPADRGAMHDRRYDGRGSGSSDAARADRPHGDPARHAEAVRHARHTAAAHRHAAAYRHHTAAARHHAWAAYGYRHPWYRPVGWFRPYRPGHWYWYHGVFVYGPGYGYHHQYVEGDGGGHEQLPERKVDRARTFALGVRGGSYMGAYDVGGGGFGDAGLGLAMRYRPVEAVGLEVSWMHHDQSWDEGSERVYQPLQASVQLFAMPWTKVNPYALAGVTVASRQVHDDIGFTQVDQADTLVGPHAGVGIEFGVGEKASINFDVRYAGYLNKPQGDLTVPGALQANMGLNFYF